MMTSIIATPPICTYSDENAETTMSYRRTDGRKGEFVLVHPIAFDETPALLVATDADCYHVELSVEDVCELVKKLNNAAHDPLNDPFVLVSSDQVEVVELQQDEVALLRTFLNRPEIVEIISGLSL